MCRSRTSHTLCRDGQIPTRHIGFDGDGDLRHHSEIEAGVNDAPRTHGERGVPATTQDEDATGNLGADDALNV